jgi:hypothetical protein
MKSTFTILLFISVYHFTFAQSENNMSFEMWEGGNPVGWFTSNVLNIYIPVTQSTDAYGGSYAVKGTVVETTGGGSYTALISSGPLANGLPINFRAESLSGWYKFSSDSNDFFSVTAAMYKNGRAIGSGFFYSYNIEPAYKQFNLNINYNSAEIPDTARIVILIAASGGVTHPGSTFYLDELSFGGTTAVNTDVTGILTYNLKQNYPNPFNPSTRIDFSIPETADVRLVVYDALGREVKELLNKQVSAGRYSEEFNGGGLASGIYYCRIIAGGFIRTIPMALLK